jgi:spermidine synthase
MSVLAVLFFFSGLSALVYQILWLRLLALVFGVTIHATTTVLASFMAGLAIGSAIGGRIAERTRRPLLWFALAEALVAVSALATPVMLERLQQAYITLHATLPDVPGLVTMARLACSFAVLAVPTTMMGATLPLMVRSSAATQDRLGLNVSVLYASNTAGALTGTLLAGFYLIGALGIWRTLLAAVFVNLSVSVAAVCAALMVPAVDRTRVARAPAADPTAEAETPLHIRRLILSVFVLSGFTSLALEVIWVRVLVLFIPATIYAFATILATFLGGIAAGSYIIAPLMRRRRDWVSILAAVEIAIGILPLLSLAALAATYQAGWRTSATVQASIVTILPSTLLMGIAFPIGLRLWAGETPTGRDHHSARVGRFYALNVCGGILGAIVGGFLMLPVLGSRGSLILLASLSVMAGLLLAAVAPSRRRSRLVTAGGVAAFAAAALTLPDPFAAVLARRYRGERQLWREEGIQATVSVHERATGARVLYLDGLHQANDTAEMVTVHRQIGLLPLALHPDPHHALVVGLGGGVTAGAASAHDGVDVDVVELSHAVVKGSEWFRHVNYDLLRRPSVRLRIDDGRNYLMLTERRYDVVTADLIQPIHAGAGNLYSVEYFRLTRKAMQDDGIVLQWIGDRPEMHYNLILRTFISVFPETTLWANGTLMVGRTQPLGISRGAFERKLHQQATRSALAEVGIDSFDRLLALYTAGPDELRRFAGAGPLLTDDHPRLEYERSLPKDVRPVERQALKGDVARHVID